MLAEALCAAMPSMVTAPFPAVKPSKVAVVPVETSLATDTELSAPAVEEVTTNAFRLELYATVVPVIFVASAVATALMEVQAERSNEDTVTVVPSTSIVNVPAVMVFKVAKALAEPPIRLPASAESTRLANFKYAGFLKLLS